MPRSSLSDLASQLGDVRGDTAALAVALLADPTVKLLAATAALPARHWWNVWRIKQSNAARGGSRTVGFPEALESLARLGETPLRLVTYEVEGAMALFWMNEAEALVAFAVLDRR